jgi:hypothetical protein
MEPELTKKEKIKLSALVVNSNLDDYIKLHDLILKKQGTLVSFIKNLLGLPPPFKNFLEESLKLTKKFESTVIGIKKVKDEITENLTSNEIEYLNHLLDYAMALYNTTNILCKRQNFYYQKSLSNKSIKFNWPEAKQVQKEYEQSINEYLRIGKKLNRMNYIFFG